MQNNYTLYQHQITSVQEMEHRERFKKIIADNTYIETDIGIQADKTGYGKCLGKNTPVIMFDGSVKFVQDIQVGDVIMGDNSSPRNVLSTTSGKETMYKIIQSNGDNYVVNESHIMSLFLKRTVIIKKNTIRYFDRSKNDYVFKNFESYEELNVFVSTLEYASNFIDISIKDYLNLPTRIKRSLRGYKKHVNCWTNRLSPTEDIDPFYLGTWLGLCSKQPCLTKYQLFEMMKDKLKLHFTGFSFEIMKMYLNKYDLNCHTTLFIPEIFKINTIENRLKILNGIFEVDGLEYEHNRIVRCSKQLKKDILFISNSLGICVFSNESRIKLKKLDDVDTYYGFTIDGNHRFLLGDFTVTHNTLSMVSLIDNNKMEWDISTPHELTFVNSFGKGRVKQCITEKYDKISTTLILASQSIISQWEEEFKKTTLSTILVNKKKLALEVDVEEYDVILVTPTMFNSLVHRIDKAWKRFVYDEPSQTRIPSMAPIIAGFTWFVTATPYSIRTLHGSSRDSLMYFFREFYYINCLIIKNDDSYVEESFRIPPANNFSYTCYNPIYTTTRGLVNDKISEMLSAGNISGALKTLGGKETDNLVSVIKEKKNKDIQELEALITLNRIRDNPDRIIELTNQIAKIKTEIVDLDTRYHESLSGDCAICIDKIKTPVLEPNCQNIFCGECLLTWMKTKTSCPLCRIEIDMKNICYLEEKTEDDENDSNRSSLLPEKMLTKTETIVKIIKNNVHGKYIIFSEWDNSFNSIRIALLENHIKFMELTGTVETRTKNLEKFKTGKIQAIFLNSATNSSGINLQEATDIIIYHEMSVDTLSQILGRANRIGRTESLNVHHLQV
jgi:hypothetical protein